MSYVLQKEVDSVLNSIREYMEEQDRIRKSINLIVYEDVTVRIGGRLLESLINLLEITFNDKNGIFEWYIFENDFGKNNLKKKIDGHEISIDSTNKILEILLIKAKHIDGLDRKHFNQEGKLKNKKDKHRRM